MPKITTPAGMPDGNPLVVVSAQEVANWMRQLADDAGLSDRESCVIQVTDSDGRTTLGSPTLVFMVSNIPNSRKA